MDATLTEKMKVWVKVCSLDQLPEDKASGFTVNGTRLVAARCGGEAYITQGYCSHMLFPLAGGKVEDCVLRCSLHHSTFNLGDGSVKDWSTFPPLIGAAMAAIRQSKGLRTYQTKVENGDVYIEWTADSPESVRIRF